MISEPIIIVENLQFSYATEPVIHNLSFSVEKGKVFGLLGKNGAGKTTTINLMMGFLRPKNGFCRIFGNYAHELSNATKANIALLHEGHLGYNFLTIEQAYNFYSSFYPKWDDAVFQDLIDKLSLPLNRKISQMSCGQRSQVALALLMAQNADLLMLDDFSMGLDAGYRRLFLDHLNYYVKERKKTALITSHIVQDLERLVDDALILDKGHVLRYAPLNKIKNDIYGYSVTGEGKIDFHTLIHHKNILDISHTTKGCEIVTTLLPDDFKKILNMYVSGTIEIKPFELSLEDLFITLTGKY